MPKKKITLTIRAYEKDNIIYSDYQVYSYSYEGIFHIYMEFVKLLIEGQFTYIVRFDLVSPSRLLFSFCSLRSYLEQKNLTINFNPY